MFGSPVHKGTTAVWVEWPRRYILLHCRVCVMTRRVHSLQTNLKDARDVLCMSEWKVEAATETYVTPHTAPLPSWLPHASPPSLCPPLTELYPWWIPVVWTLEYRCGPPPHVCPASLTCIPRLPHMCAPPPSCVPCLPHVYAPPPSCVPLVFPASLTCIPHLRLMCASPSCVARRRAQSVLKGTRNS